MKYTLLPIILVVVLTLLSTPLVFAESINSYRLVDNGLSNIPPSCPSKTTNNKGVSINNVRRGDFGVTDLILNSNVIDTINPPSDAINSSVDSIAINNRSQVVGDSHDFYRPTSERSDAFFWQGGILQIIANAGSSGHLARALDINNYGYAIGFVTGIRGFAWREGNVFNLPGLGSGYIFPTCIDDEGIIHGSALDSPTFQNHLTHWIPLDANGNYNNGYINDYNTGYNNGYNNNYNSGYNNGYIAPY